MPELDGPGQFARCDPQGMLERIAELPFRCEDGWQRANKLVLPDLYHEVNNIIVIGMGGSAIGADLLRTLVAHECQVPIVVHRDYGLPGFVGPRTLVIASSHSGDTEETVAGFESALQRGAQIVSITTGGELARRTRDGGLPLYSYDYPVQPRAAIGYSLIALLGVVQHLGLVSDKSADLAEAVAVMKQWQSEIKESVATRDNAAKLLATKLYERLPVVYGAEHLSQVARRWKTQLNENAKSWAEFDVLPELNHNTVTGYGLPSDLSSLAHVIMLTSDLNHPRVRLRFEITQGLLETHGIALDKIEARGRSPLAQLLSTVHFGDYVSYYLAMLYDVDPWSIGSIQSVKQQLSKRDT
jgi:glucose/mannose-6-phosphate isomerase